MLTRHRLFHDPSYPSCEALDDSRRALVADFNAKVAAGEIAFHTADTCLCGAADFDGIATYDRYRLWQPVVICRACGLIQCRPRMADATLPWFYGSDLYRRIYNPANLLPHTREKFLPMATSSAVARRQGALRRLGDFPAIRHIGEIGCGGGWNLWNFHQDGIRVTGCDYSSELTAAGRAMGMDIRQGATDALAGETFDLLIMSHVLEHMPDPAAEIARARDLLSENGLLYIEVPDCRAMCLGLFQNAHLWYFTPNRLRDLAAEVGLAVVAEDAYSVGFSLILRRDPAPPRVDLSGEYTLLRDIIRRFERRETAKDALRRLGLFGLARLLREALRR